MKPLSLSLLALALLGAAALLLLPQDPDRLPRLGARALAAVRSGAPRDPGAPLPGHAAAAAAPDPAARPSAVSAAAGRETAAEAERLQQRLARRRSFFGLTQAYGPLIRKLALPTASAQSLETLLAQEQQAALEAIQALRTQGTRATAAYVAAVREAAAPLDRQISDLLGAEGFQDFETYRQTLVERATVNRLAEQVAASAPLQDGQRAQISLLLQQMEPPGMHGNEDALSLMGIQEVPLTGEMVAAAGAVLSPLQVEALRSMQETLQARGALAGYLRANGP